MSELAIVVIIQAALHLGISIIHRVQWLSFIKEKEREWSAERKDLLDRIQAPSFAEYTNKVVREKKAEQPKEETEPVEFVS